LDPVLRYVGKRPGQNTPEYVELDLHVGWHVHSNLELALVGQNLLHDHHPEFGTASEMQRGVYGKVTWRW
jgi:iron complex outermembrane recepter protein